MKKYFVLSLSIGIALASTVNAYAGKRIIVNEDDLKAIFEVKVEGSEGDEDLSALLNKSVALTNDCYATARVFFTKRNNPENPNRITDYSVSMESSCLTASLVLYEKIRTVPGAKVVFLVPKPVITGSN
ncbi:MAG: hypothetical protein AB7K68_16615 [Bacteriovoracia bacterium]